MDETKSEFVEEEEETVSQPPNSILLHLPCRHVDDVDQELFFLWTLNAKQHHDGGLGYVDHSHDTLYLWFENNSKGWSISHIEPDDEADAKKKTCILYQNVTSLRSCRGNTGSIIWRSTVQLANQIRRGHIFNLDALRNANVLELGSGTGALPLMTSDLVNTWVATDQPDLVGLLSRNLAKTPNSIATQLDWFDFLNPSSQSILKRRRDDILGFFNQAYPDMILCCDCVYNPALFDALVATIHAFTKPLYTIVLIVAEMRTDDAVSAFLTAWIESSPDWCLLSL